MRPGRDADTVHVRHPKSEPDRHPEPDALGEPVRDRDRRRVHDALPIAVCDCFNLAERYPESLSLALSPLPQALESVEEEIQGKLEFDLVVAPRADHRLSFVGGRGRDLQYVGILRSHLAEHDLLHLRVD